MPFLALVYVPDGHTADRIVERYSRGDAGRIVGLFRYPVKSEIGHLPKCKGEGWSRDPEGFMKCGSCGQRNPNIRRFVINSLFDHLGANFLPNPPGAFRTPEGYSETFAPND